MEDGLVKVVTPIDDTPAAKAGVHGERRHHPARRRAGAGPDPEPGGREDARAGQHQDQADHHAQGPGQADRGLDHARRHPRALGAHAHRGRRHRLHPHHPVQRADLGRPEEGDQRHHRADPERQAARATCSTCATIRAACSTRRSRCRMRSSSAARSSRPAAATPRRPSATRRARATSPRASRSSC